MRPSGIVVMVSFLANIKNKIVKEFVIGGDDADSKSDGP
jgi:hypothetical protein